ncbi:siroheme synthase CysG [Leucothrix pacifica]|uniref:Siroheme synthase n=1 Tax=Leucothrix pacifica TaxID=1247513 RepID=A0A317CL53_9GAMM|nr:siroheme synthase CysG [Leucothrix pacifica]PWQ98153.1 uroporphyrinogen-III C-methyltransferase [Leucothrix pacifica]
MKHFPIFVSIRNKPCVVIGGGPVASRKIGNLLEAGAQITVVSPQITEEIKQYLAAESITYLPREYTESDLEGAFLVFAATDNREVNSAVAALATSRDQLVNVADEPDECTFVLPSVLDRSPVLVAVSTGGASPVLARQLRIQLETLIPSACGRLAGITEEYREKVKRFFPKQVQRKKFWENALHGPVSELVYAGQEGSARTRLDEMLEQGLDKDPMGEVYLVGAGPGDPDLLTFKAVRLMQRADVMVYDRLVSQPILDMANPDAERLYVGKQKDDHAVPQHKINDLLVDLAKQGKRVLRLKGGDPFIFGRGGEEIETLTDNGVPFQVVPAVTAASGCSSYAGIPLTHRDYAQSVTFATGHLKDGTVNLDWPHLTQLNQTLVFYMGLSGIAEISKQLQAHGMSPDMPAALIEKGTTRHQRVHIATLATLPEKVVESGVRAPTLTIIGEVVKLHDKLHWYEPERHVKDSDFSLHQS